MTKLASSYLGGTWSDRVSRPSGWMVYAVTYLAFALARETCQMWALFTLYGTYYGLIEPAEKALVWDLALVDARERAYEFYNFIVGFGAIPAGLLMGFLWQTYSPTVALATTANLAALAAITLRLIQGLDRREV